MKQGILLLAAVLACIASPSAIAQKDVSAMTNTEIAKQSTDPMSNLWLVITEFSTSFTPGSSYNKTNQSTIDIQPVMPVSLTRSWRVLNFPELVLASQGSASGSQINGVQNFSWLGAFSPAWNQMGFCWGVGPYISFPVSSNPELAPSQWQVGGGAAASYQTTNAIAVGVLKGAWATSNNREVAGNAQFQYNIQRFFGDGYQVGLGHLTISYTWNRKGEGAWNVPFGVNIGKVFRIGPMPVKIILEYEYFVLNDNNWNPQHLFRVTILPIVQSPQKGPIFDD